MRIAITRPTWCGHKSLARPLVILAIAIGLTSSLTDIAASEPRKSVPLRLEVKLQRPTEGTELRITLTNISKEVVVIDELDLPWIAPNELEFLKRAYGENSSQRELQMKGPMVDYFGRTITILPGHSLRGTLELRHYVHGIEEALGETDVTVEWKCHSHTVMFVCTEGEGGHILISKKQVTQKNRTPSTRSHGERP